MANVDLIVSVLEKEKWGLCSGTLLENPPFNQRRGVPCFIGALLYHAGYTRRRLSALDGHLTMAYTYREFDEGRPCRNTREYHARKKLNKVYGLTDAQIDAGIAENDLDSCESPLYRRDRMIAWVRENWS